jgi:hypothetical protein
MLLFSKRQAGKPEMFKKKCFSSENEEQWKERKFNF